MDLGYYSVFGVNLLCMEKQINMQSVSPILPKMALVIVAGTKVAKPSAREGLVGFKF